MDESNYKVKILRDHVLSNDTEEPTLRNSDAAGESEVEHEVADIIPTEKLQELTMDGARINEESGTETDIHSCSPVQAGKDTPPSQTEKFQEPLILSSPPTEDDNEILSSLDSRTCDKTDIDHHVPKTRVQTNDNHSKLWKTSTIGMWKVLGVGAVVALLYVVVVATVIQFSGDGGDELLLPIFGGQLNGTALTENIYASDSGLVDISDLDFTMWSNDEETIDSGITEELRFLIDLLAPIVSELGEEGGDDIHDYIASRRNDATIVLKGSPQHSALVWLSHAIVCSKPTQDSDQSTRKEDPECMALLSRSQLLNRYALATMYFAWNGKSWQDADGWLSYHSGRGHPASSGISRSPRGSNGDSQSNIGVQSRNHPSNICMWKGVTCRDQPPDNTDGLFGRETNRTFVFGSRAKELRLENEWEEQIVGLDLSEKNLIGFMGVVKEIRLMEHLQDLNLSQNHLEGSVPSEVGMLEGLQSLDLSHNNLSGSLPTSISRDLFFLETVILQDNFLKGGLEGFRFAPPCQVAPWKAFSADCAGTKPEVECPCCISCCGTSLSETAINSLRGSTKVERTKIESTVCEEQVKPREPSDNKIFASTRTELDDYDDD